jgi:hypothetical protein
MPVLAMFASQVATCTGDAEPEMAGEEVIERCLFDGAYINNGRFTIDKSV